MHFSSQHQHICEVGRGSIGDVRQSSRNVSCSWALLTAMFLGGPVALAVKRLTAPIMAEVEREFLASVQEHRTADGRYLIPGEFVTLAGRR
jgi:hypothetical protein